MSGLPLDALFEALANGLWRGCLLALAAAVLLRLVKRTTASERYAVWLAVLAVVALAPAAEALIHWARPVGTALEISLPSADAFDSALIAPTQAPVEVPKRWEAMAISARPFLVLWGCVSLALAVRLWRRCALAGRLKLDASLPAAGLAAAVEEWECRLASRRVGVTLVTRSLRSPAAVGWLEPAVLLPEDEQGKADSADLEMLWRHEQAHVARRDDWTQLFAECLFALAWFHPAAHWVRRQLEKERELACDETVVNGGVEAGRYAGALGRWAERAALNELPAGVMGLGQSRALIIRRIEMLLSPSRILRRNGGRWAFAGSLAAALGASVLLVVSGPVVIRAQSLDAPVAVDVEVAAEPEVDITAPFVQVTPVVSVEPVILSQVAQPAPPRPPAPAPIAVPAPPAPPAAPARGREERAQESEARAKAMAERDKHWQEEMRPQIEAIQHEAKLIAERVQAQMGPQREKLQALAKQMSEEHGKSIRPLAEEMAKLGARMAEASDTQRKELEDQMEGLSKQMAAKEPEFKRLEEEMSKIEIYMRPFEEEMKKLEEGLREKTKAFEESEKKFQESVQPIPPER